MAVDLIDKTFHPVKEVNGQVMYKSTDDEKALCFSVGDLIGGGYWLIKEYDPSDETCEVDGCGAEFYAEHDKLSRCVLGSQFKKWESDAWVTTTDSFHRAISGGTARKYTDEKSVDILEYS